MKFKLRGTNVIAIEVLAGGESFDLDALKDFLKEKSHLLKGARLVLSVEGKRLDRETLSSFLEFMKGLDGITFCGLKTDLKENRELCISMGVPCDLAGVGEGRKPVLEEVKFVKKTLRSGDRITFPGDVVIMGDVNPGAEVEAEGNVYVMGNLRGVVRAGIGKSQGEVRAFFFQAPRLELCGRELIFERGESFVGFRARVKDGEVKLESRNP